ncbi:hypothetical protein [Cohaesibacter marisflavi]|uniref:hypothetical protein n=1 Tax=Cohaesibacter marisflavi TaxID=655353 RepID=UPI0029C85893|nr:hypothetical protein [Cohaesibacter marisflavi]
MMKEKSAAKRNPKWSRDELILTLDFFFDHSPHFPDKASKEVAELSSLLNELGLKISTQKNLIALGIRMWFT